MIRPSLAAKTVLLAFALSACGPDSAFLVNEEGDNTQDIDSNGTSSDRASKAQSKEQKPNISDLDAKGVLEGSDELTAEALAACNKRKGKTVTRSIAIPNPDQVCEWGIKGNLPDVDNIVSGRREQYANLNVPHDAIICNMEFDFAEQRMRYDDEILLTMNGIVLTSSQDYSQQVTFENGSERGELIYEDGLSVAGDFVIYDWKRLRGLVYHHNYSPQYCLGENLDKGSCKIPPTEQDGKIKIQLENSLITRIGLLGRLEKSEDEDDDAVLQAIRNAPRNKIGWVTTGDDNGSDCTHRDVNFKVKVRYLE